MRRLRPLHVAVAALVLLSLIWGYNWVVMKEVMRYVDPFDFTAMRTLLGALALFAVLAVKRRPMRPVALRGTFLLGMLQTAAFTALIQWALVGGGAGKTAVLVYAMPFWLLPMAWLLLGERVRGAQWGAVAVALAGLLLIIEPWALRGDFFSALLALAGGFVWAMSAVVAKRLRAQVELDLLALTAWQMLLGALALCVLAGVLPSQPLQPSAYFFAALVYNALLATGLAWLLWLFILDRMPAGLAGLSSLAVPAVGVLSGWAELGERPSAAEGVGMLLIALALGAISLLAMRGRRLAGQGVSADSRN